LLTQAETHELQHHISRTKGQAYQIIGTVDLDSTDTSPTILHLRNISQTRFCIITFYRFQSASLGGGLAIPNSNNYFQFGTGTTYVSGGATATPVNSNFASANTAEVTAFTDNPSTSGTFTELDRYYTNDNTQERFEKQGSIILGTNDALEVRFVGDNDSGAVYTRVTFLMTAFD
ncbi:unnamed protein product, partial [marine sediment metagenome]